MAQIDDGEIGGRPGSMRPRSGRLMTSAATAVFASISSGEFATSARAEVILAISEAALSSPSGFWRASPSPHPEQRAICARLEGSSPRCSSRAWVVRDAASRLLTMRVEISERIGP
ncbi:hypothetical protein ABIB06_001092 [Bradyrhizobium sp. LB8.2]